jgi:ADP-ribosyl-[dinitrogen reductase] hydrolase
MTTETSQATAVAIRVVGAVWGHLVGDAVGVPYEFRDAARIGEIRFGASGTHGQPPGTWSDDGSLMLALLDSLTAVGFDTDDQGRRIVDWYRQKAYTPDGDGFFDVGNATRNAIHSLEQGVAAGQAGGTDERSNGNGSLMRILPLAVVLRDDSDHDLATMASQASSVTHGTARAQVACALYTLIAKRLLAGISPREALTDAQAVVRGIYADDPDRLAALDHLENYRDRGGRGRVWDSFWSAWDAFAGADSYRETIERAIGYGNDTDTTAAIAGGLAGIHWGIDGIPTAWLAGMRGRSIVEPLMDRVLAQSNWRTSTTSPIRVPWVVFEGARGEAPWPGKLGMTFLPGKQRDGWGGLHWRTLETDLRRLKEEHATDSFLLLVDNDELRQARVVGVEAAFERHGIELVRVPIVDEDVPDDRAAFRLALDTLLERLVAGRNVVVACRGGLGRTGMAVACLLVDGGFDPEAAIQLTHATRKHTLTNREQQDYVRSWDRR